MLTKADIEQTLNRTLLPPPKDIYYFTNARITIPSDRLPGNDIFNNIISRLDTIPRPGILNVMERDRPEEHQYGVLGMHPYGDNMIVLTHDSPDKTILHESIHNVGVSNEVLTRLITKIVYARNKYGILNNLGLHLHRQVKYDEVPVSEDEKMHIMNKLNMELHDRDYSDVHLVHLVLKG